MFFGFFAAAGRLALICAALSLADFVFNTAAAEAAFSDAGVTFVDAGADFSDAEELFCFTSLPDAEEEAEGVALLAAWAPASGAAGALFPFSEALVTLGLEAFEALPEEGDELEAGGAEALLPLLEELAFGAPRAVSCNGNIPIVNTNTNRRMKYVFNLSFFI